MVPAHQVEKGKWGQAGQPDNGACSPRLSVPIPFQLEGQCTALHNDKHETKAENAKLKVTNQELAQELERTSQELQGAQQQLESLQQEACKLQQEKEMWVCPSVPLTAL